MTFNGVNLGVFVFSKKQIYIESNFGKKLNITNTYNYRHLYYFWVVAKEGSVSKAAECLDMAIQTIRAQVHELEKSLGCMLFKPAGR